MQNYSLSLIFDSFFKRLPKIINISFCSSIDGIGSIKLYNSLIRCMRVTTLNIVGVFLLKLTSTTFLFNIFLFIYTNTICLYHIIIPVKTLFLYSS